MLRRIRREPAVADLVTERIRTAILSGELPPGARIRQEELAERLAVSRAPIRQALPILEREGLIRPDRGRGMIVAPMEIEAMRDLYQFRGIIESEVAKTLAAQKEFPAASIRKIIDAGRAAAAKHDITRLIELDLEFHTGLYDAYGNRVLSGIMRSEWTHIRRAMAGTLHISAGYPEQVWNEHEAILNAIEAHDVNLAGIRAAGHTNSASERLVKHLEEKLRSEEKRAVPLES